MSEVIPSIKDKEGDRDDPSNCRPISLLPIISKVCERAAHLQLVHFLEDYSIIHPLQSGNRKFHSTESALLYFTDEILKSMDEKRISVVVPLDMTKAFSTIRHDIPLAKLRRIGISSSALAWFNSYIPGHNDKSRSEDWKCCLRVIGAKLWRPLGIHLMSSSIKLMTTSRKLPSGVGETQSILLNPDKTKLLVIGVPQLTKTLQTLSISFMGKKLNLSPQQRTSESVSTIAWITILMTTSTSVVPAVSIS